MASPNFAGPDPAPRSLLRWCSLGLLVLFLASVAWELNGSSVGMWSNLLSEKTAPEGLLFSSPKRVRGDEWTVWTPAMLSQAQQTPPFPIENPSLGAGRTPLIMSVPVAYYTTVFRPQLWGFFIFNFERGFSFYWCVKVFGLLFAVGWCLRQIGLRSAWLTIFGAVWIFFSSFTQWWFSSPAMLPEMIASWAICLGCAAQMLRPSTRWRTARRARRLRLFRDQLRPLPLPAISDSAALVRRGDPVRRPAGNGTCPGAGCLFAACPGNAPRRPGSDSVLDRCAADARARWADRLSRIAPRARRRSFALQTFLRPDRLLRKRAGRAADLQQHRRGE